MGPRIAPRAIPLGLMSQIFRSRTHHEAATVSISKRMYVTEAYPESAWSLPTSWWRGVSSWRSTESAFPNSLRSRSSRYFCCFIQNSISSRLASSASVRPPECREFARDRDFPHDFPYEASSPACAK
jgi:hypothetical protein